MSHDEERRSLSSPFTFFSKFIVPAFLILVLGLITVMTIFNYLGFDINELLIVTAICLILLWLNIPLKFVEANKDYLYVSNFRRTDQIHLSNIKKVTAFPYPYLTRIHNAWIEFRNPTAFGTKITFLPFSRALVKELQEQAKASNKELQ